MTNEPKHGATLRFPRERGRLRDCVVVDGAAMAIERGREWAGALGAELVICRRRNGGAVEGRIVEVPRTFHPARVAARLMIVEAAAGHVRWRVHHAKSPFLVARARSTSGRILIAVDLPDEHVIEWIARGAREREVTLVHSIEPGLHEAEWMALFGSTAGFVPEDVHARRRGAEKLLTELLARYDLHGDVRVGLEPAHELVLATARELQPDLIAVGAPQARGLFQALRRTVVGEIAATAPSSVLVVPRVES
jgi:nucleotide-binding universal stress UspA family protein